MVLSGPQAGDFLRDIWSLVNDKLKEATQPFDPAPFDFKTTTARIGDFPAVIVECPDPIETAECHYACAVLLLDLTLEQRPDPKSLPIKYFTLELNDMAPQKTMLCGWQYDKQGGNHQNFGAGPAAGQIRTFAEAIKELLHAT